MADGLRVIQSAACRFPSRRVRREHGTDSDAYREPRCAVLRALAEGWLDQARYESFLKLRRELAYEEARTDSRVTRERKEQERRIHRIYQKQHRK